MADMRPRSADGDIQHCQLLDQIIPLQIFGEVEKFVPSNWYQGINSLPKEMQILWEQHCNIDLDEYSL